MGAGRLCEGGGPADPFRASLQEKSPAQRRRFRALVEGTETDGRRPASGDRALLTRLLMGKGGVGRAPPVGEGKSLLPHDLCGRLQRTPHDPHPGVT